MKYTKIFLWMIIVLACNDTRHKQAKIFDVHLHGDKTPDKQLADLKVNGVEAVAVSTSWPQQQNYLTKEGLSVLHGLFVPCPNGKVPYSQQMCFEDGKEWPALSWVEQQVLERRIDFIGEVLTQYHGISSSDSMMFPYYALAEKYDLPIGIHTGLAGPDHGCPNFKEEMGNPLLLKKVLIKFPRLRVWLMHGGGPYIKECIEMMQTYPNLYADISVLNNPNIVSEKEFEGVMKEFMDAGLEDRLMFGSDNADIKTTIAAVNKLKILSAKQKEKIFYLNANIFFRP